MPTKQYNIYVKGLLSFTKYTQREFDKICKDMDTLNVNYTTKIIRV